MILVFSYINTRILIADTSTKLVVNLHVELDEISEKKIKREWGGGRGQLKCDCTRAETRFRLSAKRTSPFKSSGASVQSTTGSRAVRIGGSNARYTMFRGNVKGTGYLLNSPFSP